MLDLFAGSGGLGLEAISRGAEYAVFCDIDRNAAKLIESNIRTLCFDKQCEVFSLDCFSLISQLGLREDKFSLVLLDPPYNAGFLEKVLNRLVNLKLLCNGCIILAEHSWKQSIDFDSLDDGVKAVLEFREPRKYGDTGVTYIRFSGDRE